MQSPSAFRSQRILFTSFATVLSCSAPAADDAASSVPEFSGIRPSTGPSGSLPAPPQGAPPPSGVSTGAAPEAPGNAPSVPLDNDNSGASASPSSPVAPVGAGGGSSTGAPDEGAGGSAMPAAAGSGNDGAVVPPVDDGTPATDGTPPPASVTPLACAQPGAFFCEDFEAAPLGVVQGNLNGLRPERSVSVVDEPGRGQVLQVQAGSTYGNKNGVFLDDFSAPNGSHFGRAFIRVEQFPTAGGDHWVVVEAVSSAGGDSVRPVGGQFSRWAPGADGPSAGDWTDWEQSDAETTAGAWECVEWQISGNDLSLWVNGLEVQPLDRPGFRVPALDQLWLGWVVYQNAQPPMYDVRFDDLVLSTERVGCN